MTLPYISELCQVLVHTFLLLEQQPRQKHQNDNNDPIPETTLDQLLYGVTKTILSPHPKQNLQICPGQVHIKDAGLNLITTLDLLRQAKSNNEDFFHKSKTTVL